MLGFLKRYKPNATQAVQADFVANVQSFADSFVQTWTAFEPELNYSVGSVAAVQALLEQARQGGVSFNPVQKVEAAAYIYEVARREYGGLYEVCDDDDPVVLVTGQAEFEVCLCAISKVEALTSTLCDEGLVAFFDQYVRAVQTHSSQTIR